MAHDCEVVTTSFGVLSIESEVEVLDLVNVSLPSAGRDFAPSETVHGTHCEMGRSDWDFEIWNMSMFEVNKSFTVFGFIQIHVAACHDAAARWSRVRTADLIQRTLTILSACELALW